jgi:hypothetical protein
MVEGENEASTSLLRMKKKILPHISLLETIFRYEVY